MWKTGKTLNLLNNYLHFKNWYFQDKTPYRTNIRLFNF